MRLKLLTLLILLIPLINANLFNSESLTMNVEISGKIDIKKTEPYIIKFVRSNLTFFPKDTIFQDISKTNINPSAKVKENSILYEWENPKNVEVFKADYIVKVDQNKIKIKSKIKFPINNLNEEYKIYILPTPNIESENPEIIKKASEIVEGEDDLFEAIFKIAVWIKSNINYSLDTLTEKAVQKSTWVLEHRYGVCDEITNLFIAMMRSVGIPARYVSGLAYTNYNDLNDWSPHAWAEVYFPNIGWVSFDITYNELGYVDPSHIVLLYSLDSGTTSTTYEWKANNVEIEASPLNFDVFIKEKGQQVNRMINITPTFDKEGIAFGSYNLLNIEFENKNNHYEIIDYQISKPKEVEVLSNATEILLKPNEKKNIKHIIKLKDDLNKNYVYEFPLAVITSNNESFSTSFKSSRREEFYEKDYFYIEKESNEKEIKENIEFNCFPELDEYYINEVAKINCTIKNTGNAFINKINVDNQSFNLGISQEKSVTINKELTNINKKVYPIKIQDSITNVQISVKDYPKIKITEINYPENVKYLDLFSIELMLEKVSRSEPKDVIVKVDQNNYIKEYKIADFNNNKKFILEVKGSELDENTNNIFFEVTYEDDNSNEYKESENIEINLIQTTLFEKIKIWFRNLNRILE